MGVRSSLSIYIIALGLFFGATLSLNPILLSSALAAKNTTNGAAELPSGKPIFKKRKIKIGIHTITVEIADNEEKRAHGLMFREKMDRDAGMLFIFSDESERAFWMQNTLIPLSIAYFSRAKILNEVIDMQPAVMGVTRPKTYPSKSKAMYALEMNIGWFEQNKIRPGVSFRFADN